MKDFVWRKLLQQIIWARKPACLATTIASAFNDEDDA